MRLTLRQRIVLLVALGAALWVLGQWVIEQASPFGGFWTGTAPLTSSPDFGLHRWVQAVLWLLLIAVWTIAALLLLREPKRETLEVKEGDPMEGGNQ
jgi:hypothetical protein